MESVHIAMLPERNAADLWWRSTAQSLNPGATTRMSEFCYEALP